jgi:hypothetical protein
MLGVLTLTSDRYRHLHVSNWFRRRYSSRWTQY